MIMMRIGQVQDGSMDALPSKFSEAKEAASEHFQLDRLQIPDVLGDGHQPNRKDLYIYIYLYLL